MMLAVTFSFVMLGFGGAGGIINMSYQLNETIHNTQWVTGHFHLIFAGAIVIMYFMVAYELWPQLTGCAPLPQRLIKAQLWLWFVGMMVLTDAVAPGRPARHAAAHGVLRLHAPRRSQPQAWTVIASAHRRAACWWSRRSCSSSSSRARARGGRRDAAPFTFSSPVHPGGHTPVALNGFGLWVAMMIGADGRELRLPDRPARVAEGSLGAGHPDREPMMREPACTPGATPGSAGASCRWSC